MGREKIKELLEKLNKKKEVIQLQKEKNQLLKIIKESLSIANKTKDPLAIKELGELKDQVYKIYNKNIQEITVTSKKQSLGFIPVVNCDYGAIHPLTITMRKIYNIMKTLGFSFKEAPEVDLKKNIFDNLNMGELHPAREEQQSFFIENNEKQTFRTHCTNFQSHILSKWNELDNLRNFHIGKVYRADSDATHTPMFHQFEVLCINKKCNVPSLIGFIKTFFNLFFNKSIEVRVRTSFFPFTIPSYEVDIKLHHEWLEIGGCGIVHKNVFINNGKKPHNSWAWGMGIERLTMITGNYKDIRNFFQKDIRYF